jgi:hypothetical protein
MKLKDHPSIQKLAKELKLGRFADSEKAIREFCVQRIEEIIKPFGQISDLNRFLEIVSSGLRLKFEEVNDNFDLQKVSEEYFRRGELFFKNLHRELDNETDAILIRLNNVQPWEPKYIAVIDCRGSKAWRAYFSKWHEVGHVLILTPQMSFKFRRTPVERKEPEEHLVDRVAGDLAFYSPLFLPELLARVKSKGKLTFEVIDELRATVCPGASREATIRGSVSRTPFPQLLVIADYGLKKDEQRIVNSLQMGLFPETKNQFESKLRAVEVIGNEAASKAGLRIHANMEVPHDSIIAELYNEETFSRQSCYRTENLSWWKHSRGQLDEIPIWVEAIKVGKRVFALISQAK